MVCVVGIVLAVGVPTFLRTLRASRISEATSTLATAYAAANTYFAAVQANNQTRCLPVGAGPTPKAPSERPVMVDFPVDSPSWGALGLGRAPVRYRYTYICEGGCNLPADTSLILRAEGDLDGDQSLSLFELEAATRSHNDLRQRRPLRVVARPE